MYLTLCRLVHLVPIQSLFRAVAAGSPANPVYHQPAVMEAWLCQCRSRLPNGSNDTILEVIGFDLTFWKCFLLRMIVGQVSCNAAIV